MPPLLDEGIFSRFVDAVRYQSIVFFSQFPFQKAAVVDGQTSDMIEDLAFVEPVGTHTHRLCF